MEEGKATGVLVRMIEMVEKLFAIHRREEVSHILVTPLSYLFFRWQVDWFPADADAVVPLKIELVAVSDSVRIQLFPNLDKMNINRLRKHALKD